MEKEQSVASLQIKSKDLKMMREALCLAQWAMRHASFNIADSSINHVQTLINEIDKHRPVGTDGKHGNNHTPTCGCKRAVKD